MSANYDYYRIFYYVAENSSITEAANKLFLSQSTVSRAIQNLEKELGCTLFSRSKQGITLTEEGTFLHEYVKKAFSFLSYAENHLNNIQELNKGFLRIGATELTLQYFLLPYIENFQEEFPNIHMQISFQYPERAFKLLNAGLLDIAILTTPLETDASIQEYPLADFQDVLIAGNKYQYLRNRTMDFSELQKEPFILMVKGTSARNYIDKVCNTLDMSIHPKYEVGSMPLIASMVEHNIGIGFIPQIYVYEKLAYGRVFQIKTKTSLPTRQISALTSKAFPIHSVRDVFLSWLRR